MQDLHHQQYQVLGFQIVVLQAFTVDDVNAALYHIIPIV